MKFVILLVAFIGIVTADGELPALKKFLKCAHKAIVEGVPKIPVPVHEPLVIEDLAYSGDYGLASYKIALTKNILHSLLNYTFPVLNTTAYHNPEAVAIDYDIYWPVLNISGNWALDVKIAFVTQHSKGTYNVVLREVDWSGIFNYTKPGQEAQGYNNTVHAFTLKSITDSVEVNLTGVSVGEGVVEKTIEVALLTLLNNFPASAAEFLRTQRFNGFWIEQPEHLHDLLDWCGYYNSTSV